MLEQHNKRDKTHLINLIGTRSNSTPNFSLLIGAGVSANSGVRTSDKMILEWRRQLYDQSKSEKPFQKWVEKQDWYEDEEEYSILFEEVYDQRSQRRNYVEACVKDATPSWGYIYLANIIALDYFNVVFTPNFDDLLNEACCIYADLRPLVCAHDSAVADVRVTSARPKIIKLHGDFLYDGIKNTVSETESLENNMRDKFRQFAKEYGIVIIGYGGNDRSIMDTLTMLLSGPVGYFPHGLYWCRRKEDKLSRKVQTLMRRENAYWVEVEGFDEFMAELHEGLGLTLPEAVRDPYRATTARLNRFVSPSPELQHPIIQKDITQVEAQVRRFEQVIAGQAPIEEFDRFVPYRFLGDREFARDDYEGSLPYYEKALLQNPNDLDAMMLMVNAFVFAENPEKGVEMSERMIRQDPSDWRGHFSKGFALVRSDKAKDAIESYTKALKYTSDKPAGRASIFINRSNAFLILDDWSNALLDAEKALQLDAEKQVALVNKALALKGLGKAKEAEEMLHALLRELPQTKERAYIRASVLAALGDKENMLKALKMAIGDKQYRTCAKSDPDFAEYRQDPAFHKLVY